MGDSDINNKQTREYTIDIGTLFFRVVSHWRSILLWAVVIAAAFAAVMTLTGRQTEEERAQELKELQKIYQKASDLVDAQEDKEIQLATLRDYQQNSLYMHIDPQEKHVRDVVFAIRLERDGKLNSLDVLAAAYVFGLNLAPVAEELGVDFRYVEELVEWSIVNPKEVPVSVADSTDGIQFAGLRIYIIGESDELTARIMDILQQEIKDLETELSASVAEHTVTPVVQRTYSQIDDTLQQKQNNVQQQIIALQNSVDDLENSFEAYVEWLTGELNFKEADARRLSYMTQQRQLEILSENLAARAEAKDKISVFGIIRNFILGGILGGILMVGAWIAVCVFGKRFEAANEFFTRYSVTRLGVLAPDERELGRRKTKLDRAILTHTGDYTGMDKEKTIELSAATIGNLAGSGKRLLVTGTAAPEKIRALGGELAALLPEGEIVTAPDFLCDVRTIKAMPEIDAVVLVEERSASSFDAIDREINFLDRLGKELVGAFIV